MEKSYHSLPPMSGGMPTKSMAPTSEPRVIIHGGAGNIVRRNMTSEQYAEQRAALLRIVETTNTYMRTPQPAGSSPGEVSYPTALSIAVYAVQQLEDCPLFNSGHGAVFTRDGVNELEASVMVTSPSAPTSSCSTGTRESFSKRGVGVTGVRRVKNPIKLAAAMLRAGDDDLKGKLSANEENQRDVPSAQGHTLLHGSTAEILAEKYGCEMVDPEYYFTQKRWDEHVRALEREKDQGNASSSADGESGITGTANWSRDEYLPQGTCGAVALDSYGSLCVATSTGGLTNKLAGRIGDTPVPGAGFWAEEWEESNEAPITQQNLMSTAATSSNGDSFPFFRIEMSQSLRTLLSDCLPFGSPRPSLEYSPLRQAPYPADTKSHAKPSRRTRSLAISGTGNGDSFMRTAAARTAVAIARYGGNGSITGAEALRRVSGPGGELEQSAGTRWGRTGEGEGGMIGIERVAFGQHGEVRSEIVQDHNCAGMFRAWIDDAGKAQVRVWRDD